MKGGARTLVSDDLRSDFKRSSEDLRGVSCFVSGHFLLATLLLQPLQTSAPSPEPIRGS